MNYKALSILICFSVFLSFASVASSQDLSSTVLPITNLKLKPTPIETQSSEISTALIAPDDPQSPSRDLPDAPIPVLPRKQDGPQPCPAGDGMPCALLGGRLYFRDRSHMTEHD